MHCASCLPKVHRKGARTSLPQLWGAALLHPALREVIPWMPAPIVRPAGTAQNDGERKAARRCLAKLRTEHPHLKCIVTADSLRAPAPPIETLHEDGLHAIWGGKEGDQPSLCQQVQAAEHAGRGT